MNFLDAHKILYDYINLVNATPPIDGILRRKSSLQNSRTEILSAYKIFLAHMYFYHTRTQEEYEALQTKINLLPSFVDDNVVDKYIECKKIADEKSIVGKWRNKTALPLAKEVMKRTFVDTNQALIDFYASDESKSLDSFTKQIADEATSAVKKIKALNSEGDEWWNAFCDIKDSYCEKAYRLAGVSEDNDSIDFFWPFYRLKTLAEDPSTADIFTSYKDYIFSNS